MSPDLDVFDGEVRYQFGDDLDWAAPGLDDSHWQRSTLIDVPDSTGILWVRFDLPLPAVDTPGFSVAGVAAKEVYVDGVFIGSAGRVGTSVASEQVGPIDAIFRIPDALATPGTRTVALRLSTFKRPQGATGLRLNVVAGDLQVLMQGPFRSFGIPLLFLGGFVIVALYYGILFIADRSRLPYLLTAILCVAVTGLLIAEGWRNAIGYTYDFHVVRLRIVEGFTAATGVLLVLTFLIQFDLARRKLFLGMLGILILMVLLFFADHETSTYTIFTVSLIAALGITGWAVRHQKPGAWLAFAGVFVCLAALLVSGFDFMDSAFFPAFSLLIAGLLTSVGLQTREDRKRHALALGNSFATGSRAFEKTPPASLLDEHADINPGMG